MQVIFELGKLSLPHESRVTLDELVLARWGIM
jgi:hypothetical protein